MESLLGGWATAGADLAAEGMAGGGGAAGAGAATASAWTRADGPGSPRARGRAGWGWGCAFSATAADAGAFPDGDAARSARSEGAGGGAPAASIRPSTRACSGARAAGSCIWTVLRASGTPITARSPMDMATPSGARPIFGQRKAGRQEGAPEAGAPPSKRRSASFMAAVRRSGLGGASGNSFARSSSGPIGVSFGDAPAYRRIAHRALSDQRDRVERGHRRVLYSLLRAGLSEPRGISRRRPPGSGGPSLLALQPRECAGGLGRADELDELGAIAKTILAARCGRDLQYIVIAERTAIFAAA